MPRPEDKQLVSCQISVTTPFGKHGLLCESKSSLLVKILICGLQSPCWLLPKLLCELKMFGEYSKAGGDDADVMWRESCRVKSTDAGLPSSCCGPYCCVCRKTFCSSSAQTCLHLSITEQLAPQVPFSLERCVRPTARQLGLQSTRP